MASPNLRLPRFAYAIAALGMLLGGLGGGRGLAEVVAYLGTQDAFVSAHRAELEAGFAGKGISSDLLQKAGDQLGERAWARRGINLPLAGANLILSAMLFFGSMRALARSRWGHGAWIFAAQLSIPYTIVQSVVMVYEARDAWEESAGLFNAVNTSLVGSHGPTQTLLSAEMGVQNAAIAGFGAVLVAYYLCCVIYLRRPSVSALFSEGVEEDEAKGG